MPSSVHEKILKLQEISEPYEALLYDVDGTLADNMHAHKAAYKAVSSEHGIDLDTGLIDETAGWPTVAVAAVIAERYHKDFDFEKFAKRKSAIFIERYVHETQPVEFVVKHLFQNADKKKIGIVSGGSRSTLNITLEVIKVKGLYQTMVCAGDTAHGKPSPEPFLLAAEQLGISPENCLVFEDGNPGVEGAIAAGMGWVRVDQF